MKKLLVALVLTGGGIIGAVSLYGSWAGSGQPPASGDQFKQLPVKRGRIVESISVTGILHPQKAAVVSCELSGRVVQVYPAADYNRPVKAGHPLVQLDDRLARSKLAQANAALEMASADIARAQALVEAAQLTHEKHLDHLKKGIGLQIEVDRSEMELKAARATLRLAQARREEAVAAHGLAQLGVELTTIRAPVDGVIIEKKVILGQGLSGVQPVPLFVIADSLERMQVQAQIPEADIGKIRVGMQATFTVNDYTRPDDSFDTHLKRFDGLVSEIRPMPTNLQGAIFYTAIIDIANERLPGTTDAWFLRPGMSVYVDLIRREHQNAWLMPTEALDFTLDEAYQSAEAQKKVADWDARLNAAGTRLDWKYVWMLNENGQPWPAFIRISGPGANGLNGLKGTAITDDDRDAIREYQEVLEWDTDPRVQQQLQSADGARLPSVIIEAPVVESHGLFQPPRVPKIF